MSDLINKGIVILNKNKVSEGNPTVIVLGAGRSGTTMTADILQKLGVFMGGESMSVVNYQINKYF